MVYKTRINRNYISRSDTLFSTTKNMSAVCKFFFTPNGCRYGSRCKFKHINAETFGYFGQPPACMTRKTKRECNQYNTPEGCPWGDVCKFQHVNHMPLDYCDDDEPDNPVDHNALFDLREQLIDEINACVTTLTTGVPQSPYYTSFIPEYVQSDLRRAREGLDRVNTKIGHLKC